MPKFKRQLGVRRPLKNWYKRQILAGRNNTQQQKSSEMLIIGPICKCGDFFHVADEESPFHMTRENNSASIVTLAGAFSCVEVHAAFSLIELSKT